MRIVDTSRSARMDPRDIQISLRENRLTVNGEKWQEQEAKEAHYHRVERE